MLCRNSSDERKILTIHTRALENLASLARWSEAVALDLKFIRWLLVPRPSNSPSPSHPPRLVRLVRTFRLRHDLQFMDSRGSLLIRRVGSLSMPTCGRDMATGCMPGDR